MKVNLHTQVEEAQIQIIPLIDVVFCILTFFLLAALQFTRQQAINVDLPKASSNTAASINAPGANQIVTIDAIGNIYIEKQLVRREELAQRVRNYLQANPNATLILNASRTATYNDVIETLDLLRQVGGDRVFLGIIPTSSQPIPNVPNLSVPPNFPVAPGTAPIPEINPNQPTAPNPLSIPTIPNQPPTGQDISPQVPTDNAPAPQAPASQPVAPENPN
ncbi:MULTISPECIES: biopolymer transporter ExbD [unclassified Anabaena]|uniref:ExbD/TolR family protein n=1 Tax=unclassified Anabaena TaxID=2619674 RepID=UPI000831ECB5|nr:MULTISPECIES: biopolymer transporter ExbD [unclassified Anabaena]